MVKCMYLKDWVQIHFVGFCGDLTSRSKKIVTRFSISRKFLERKSWVDGESEYHVENDFRPEISRVR